MAVGRLNAGYSTVLEYYRCLNARAGEAVMARRVRLLLQRPRVDVGHVMLARTGAAGETVHAAALAAGRIRNQLRQQVLLDELRFRGIRRKFCSAGSTALANRYTLNEVSVGIARPEDR